MTEVRGPLLALFPLEEESDTWWGCGLGGARGLWLFFLKKKKRGPFDLSRSVVCPVLFLSSSISYVADNRILLRSFSLCSTGIPDPTPSTFSLKPPIELKIHSFTPLFFTCQSVTCLCRTFWVHLNTL